MKHCPVILKSKCKTMTKLKRKCKNHRKRKRAMSSTTSTTTTTTTTTTTVLNCCCKKQAGVCVAKKDPRCCIQVIDNLEQKLSWQKKGVLENYPTTNGLDFLTFWGDMSHFCEEDSMQVTLIFDLDWIVNVIMDIISGWCLREKLVSEATTGTITTSKTSCWEDTDSNIFSIYQLNLRGACSFTYVELVYFSTYV